MQKWEYVFLIYSYPGDMKPKAFYFLRNGRREEVTPLDLPYGAGVFPYASVMLNKCGEVGWEVIKSEFEEDGDQYYLLKRPLP
jgi:hypothetical protein